MLAQGCAEAYQDCSGDGVLVCSQSASRNEESVSSFWKTIVSWSRSACVEVHKANNFHEPSRLLNGSAKDFVIPNGSSAPNGSVKLRIFPDIPCMKNVYRDKKASVHWPAARKKERFSSR